MKHALLRTLPGRAIVVGLAIKIALLIAGAIAGALPSALSVLDTVASLVILAGGSVFVVRGLAFAKRRLLWRVRRKLIISYIFIGFVPALPALPAVPDLPAFLTRPSLLRPGMIARRGGDGECRVD